MRYFGLLDHRLSTIIQNVFQHVKGVYKNDTFLLQYWFSTELEPFQNTFILLISHLVNKEEVMFVYTANSINIKLREADKKNVCLNYKEKLKT